MITFTTFKHYKSTRGQRHRVDLLTFMRGLINPVAVEAENKTDVSLWSPTTFDGRRNGENAKEISCIVYDIDDGVTPVTAWLNFAARYNTIVHTSYSHKPDFHKFRIILPLAKPIPAEHWDRAHLAALELWCNVIGKRSPSKDQLKEASKIYAAFASKPSGYKISKPDDDKTKAFIQFWQDLAGSPMPDMKALTDRARMYYRFALPKFHAYGGHPLHPTKYHVADAFDGRENLDLDYSHVKLPEPPPRPTFEPGKKYSTDEVLLSPDVRGRIATMANATIKDNVARYITCPRCRRNTVYFFIDLYLHANPLKGAKCNHEGASCGWHGSLKELT